MNAHAKPGATAPLKPPANAAVWFEIPVSDLEKAKQFYSSVLLTEFTDQHDGPNPFSVFAYQANETNVSGHLYPGKPAGEGQGPTIHLAVQDNLEAGVERLKEAGGKVLSPPIEIPAGRFVYCQDPDGNSIGLFSS